jgi:hypothetical protein
LARVVDSLQELQPLLAAPRAIVLVAVAWSPWPAKSRVTLGALEESQRRWSPNASVEFFELWPENEPALRQWYEDVCRSHAERFELHGHGYGPLWWLANGTVLNCIKKPYERSLDSLESASIAAFEPNGMARA